MGELNEFSLPTRLFLRAYRWRRIDPIPWMPLRKPLPDCRLALVSSAGLVPPGQRPFDDSVAGGDFSFRVVPSETDVRAMLDTHRSESFDHTGMHQDPDLVFPLNRVREMAERGEIGSINHRHLMFMGSITAPARLVRQTAPEAARWLVEDQVDVALLVPV